VIDPVAADGFGAGAGSYEEARPGYPDEVLELLAAHAGVAPGAVVCDLAAGTGKLTRLLARSGATVIAVEPVAAMLGELVAAMSVASARATAERLPLRSGTLDAVSVAHAFHWFDADPALKEIHRVLKPSGALALAWNRRDESTPWVAEMSRVLHWADHVGASYHRTDWAALVASSDRFEPLQEARVRWEQPMDRELLAQRVRSISFVAVLAPATREGKVREVLDLVSDQPPRFVLPYTTSVQWCRRR
jgi:ubiquinone/menaquinone biosynthesis C-methylase UbiE